MHRDERPKPTQFSRYLRNSIFRHFTVNTDNYLSHQRAASCCLIEAKITMPESCRVTAELNSFYDQSEQYDFISDEFVKPYLDDLITDRITDCTDDYVIEAFTQLNDDDNNAWLNFADIKPVDDIRTELSLAQIEHLAHVANTLNRHMTDFLGQLLQDQAEQQARAALRDL